ncbi:MAG TPA: hypothetical protein VIX59_05820 [Candidatus Binataceae bacterium]
MRARAENLKFRVTSFLGAAVAVVGLSVTSAFAAPAAPSAGLFELRSTYVCTVDATLGAPPVEKSANSASLTTTAVEQEPVHELARLLVPFNGSNITGTLFHEAAEGCTVPVTNGQLTLNSSGIGTLSLTLNIGATVDDQGDLPCSALFGGQTSLVETFHAISAETGIGLVGEESYFPIGGAPAAIVPVRGACIRQ